jgi:acetyltransferase-like isoleucine patch superfamily enzyme
MTLFYKIIYILRKKLGDLKINYLIKEQQVLFPGKILFKKAFFSKQPEFLFDASESKLIINDNTAIRGDVSFTFNEGGVIEIGSGCFFNNNCSINSLSKITIGNNCLFGEGVKIYDHNHEFKNSEVLIKDQGYTKAPIQIGDNCWIGSNVMILKGVTIGDNCVIGGGSIVFKNVPANSVVVNKVTTELREIQPVNL